MSDLRDAVRTLRATPLVSIVAILSLALGIGATTAMFSIVDSLILRALPVQHPERLAAVTNADGRIFSWTNPIWEEIRNRPDLFDGAFAMTNTRFDLSEGGETRYIDGIMASGAFFDVLGVPAQVGRVFHPADDARGGGPDGAVAVLSHDYWQRAYGGASDVAGRPVTLSGVVYTIVGVTPPSFTGPQVGQPFDVIVPLGTETLIRGSASMLDGRSSWWLQIMIRRKPSQELAGAEAALRAVQTQIREATIPANWRPEDQAKYLSVPFALTPAATGVSNLRNSYQRPLLTILVVTGLVLLIACGNIANLLLARATARRHELSVRQALGASRLRLGRQLFAESAVLAGIGAALGALIAVWGSRLLVRQLSTPTDRVLLDLGLDWRLLTFVAIVAVGTALLFGTVPALRAAGADPMDAMKEHGRDGQGGRHRLGSGLIVAQVALSLVLVVGAGLFVRTFSTLATRDLGFSTERLLTAHIGVSRSGPAEQRHELYRRVAEAVRAVPGVGSVAVATVPLVSGAVWNNLVEVPGGPPVEGENRTTNLNWVTPGWFATVRIPLLGGRDFQPSDGPEAPRVAIVNQTFAKRFVGTDDPIGRIVHVPDDDPRAPPHAVTIIGLSADAVYSSVREVVPPTLIMPMTQQGSGSSTSTLNILANGRIDGALLRGVTGAIGAIDPNISITFRIMDERVRTALIRERLVAMLSAFFGGLALLLAGLGLYGVTAYAVNRRRNEIGIRMAIGAAPSRILRLVLGRVGFQIGLGVVIGTLISIWAARFVESLLYGMPARDPITLVAAAVVLGAIGVLAGWVPARRAAAVDPARVLRDG